MGILNVRWGWWPSPHTPSWAMHATVLPPGCHLANNSFRKATWECATGAAALNDAQGMDPCVTGLHLCRVVPTQEVLRSCTGGG